MKNLFILIFVFFVKSSYAQFTYVPDDNFEQALINLGVDSVIDDYVYTSSIDTVTVLYVNNKNISDLSGIEDFISLRELFCYTNQITTLDLSNNSQLFELSCGSNDLSYINLKNGNNSGLWYFMSMNNPNLTCVDVDDVTWAEYNWARDTWTSFSNNCFPTYQYEIKKQKKLLKIVDIYGKVIQPSYNKYLIYIFSDGSHEKRFFLDNNK